MEEATSLPLCMGGILDKRSFNYHRTDGYWAMTPKEDSNHRRCKLHRYNKNDVTNCIDALSSRSTENRSGVSSNGNRPEPIHLAFVGDSRIRQHFYDFIEV